MHDRAEGPCLNKQGPPLCLLGKGQKVTSLDIYGVPSVCLTPHHWVALTPAHRMKITSFPLWKCSDSINFPWAAITCQSLEVDAKRIKMNETLGVPSLAGETDEYLILTVCSVLSERYSQEHTGDLTLPGDVEENFKTAMIELGFEGWIEVCQVDKAGKSFQREGTVSAKAQRQESGGYEQFTGEEWPARDNQQGGGRGEELWEGGGCLLGTLWSLAFSCEVTEL